MLGTAANQYKCVCPLLKVIIRPLYNENKKLSFINSDLQQWQWGAAVSPGRKWCHVPFVSDRGHVTTYCITLHDTHHLWWYKEEWDCTQTICSQDASKMPPTLSSMWDICYCRGDTLAENFVFNGNCIIIHYTVPYLLLPN